MQNPYPTKTIGSNSGTTETSASLSSTIAKNSTKNVCHHVEKKATTKESTSKKRPNARQKINNNRAQLKKEIELLKEMKRQKLLSIHKTRDEEAVVKSIITPTPNKNSTSNPAISSKVTPHSTIINRAATNPATKRRKSHPSGKEGKENMETTSKENRRDDIVKAGKIFVHVNPDKQPQNTDFLLLKNETGDQNNNVKTSPQIMSDSTNLMAIPDTSWISISASDNKKQQKPIISIPVSGTENWENDTNERSSDSFIASTQNPDGTPQDKMDPLLMQEEATTTNSQITPNATSNQVEIRDTEWNSTTSLADKDTRENHINAPTILFPKEEKSGDCGVIDESNVSCHTVPGIWNNAAPLSATKQNYYYCNNWFPNNYYNNYCYYSNYTAYQHFYPTHFPQPYPMTNDIPLPQPQPPPQFVSCQAEATASYPFYNNQMQSNSAQCASNRPQSIGASYPWPCSQRKLVKQKQLKPLYLSTNPVDFPSPWSKTHSIVSTTITICKPGVNVNDSGKKSYGIEVKYDSKYNFFAPETTPAIKEPQGADESSAREQYLTAAEAPKVPRKRRQIYGVVRVTDPGRQRPLLIENDIILSIQGVDVGLPDVSHTFSQVLSLLGNGDSGKDLVQCQLTIARAKSVKEISKVTEEEKNTLSEKNRLSAAMRKIPFIVEQKKIISGEFSEEEMMALFRRFQTAKSWDEEPKGETWLHQRETSTLHSRWLFAIHEYEEEMQTKASSFWKKLWLEEEAIASPSDTHLVSHYITDAVRSKMRGYPRPVFGCKCGSITHQRVNEDGCILYRNTRLLPPILWGVEGPNNNTISRNAPKSKTVSLYGICLLDFTSYFLSLIKLIMHMLLFKLKGQVCCGCSAWSNPANSTGN